MGVVLGLGSASDVVLMADGSVGISCPVYAALSYPVLFSSPPNQTVCCTDECYY